MSREEIARIIDEHAFDTVKMHGRHNASEQAVRSLDYALMRADKILALSAQGDPVAWLYETWCGENAWSQRYTDAEPSKNSWTRNIRPLYLAALPSSPAPIEQELVDSQIARAHAQDAEISKAEVEFFDHLRSSPAPSLAPHNSGERMPQSDPALGTGDPIGFCQEHVLNFGKLGCPKCRDAMNLDRIIKAHLPAQPGEAIFAECAEIALEHVGEYTYYWRSYDRACRDIAEAIKLRASNRKTMDAIADAAL